MKKFVIVSLTSILNAINAKYIFRIMNNFIWYMFAMTFFRFLVARKNKYELETIQLYEGTNTHVIFMHKSGDFFRFSLGSALESINSNRIFLLRSKVQNRDNEFINYLISNIVGTALVTSLIGHAVMFAGVLVFQYFGIMNFSAYSIMLSNCFWLSRYFLICGAAIRNTNDLFIRKFSFVATLVQSGLQLLIYIYLVKTGHGLYAYYTIFTAIFSNFLAICINIVGCRIITGQYISIKFDHVKDDLNKLIYLLPGMLLKQATLFLLCELSFLLCFVKDIKGSLLSVIFIYEIYRSVMGLYTSPYEMCIKASAPYAKNGKELVYNACVSNVICGLIISSLICLMFHYKVLNSIFYSFDSVDIFTVYKIYTGLACMMMLKCLDTTLLIFGQNKFYTVQQFVGDVVCVCAVNILVYYNYAPIQAMLWSAIFKIMAQTVSCWVYIGMFFMGIYSISIYLAMSLSIIGYNYLMCMCCTNI